jgi:hypothetical protein
MEIIREKVSDHDGILSMGLIENSVTEEEDLILG